MELQEIDVVIDPDGNVRIEVRGVPGAACLDLTAELEESLGAQVVSRELTPEAQASVTRAATQAEHQRIRGSE